LLGTHVSPKPSFLPQCSAAKALENSCCSPQTQILLAADTPENQQERLSPPSIVPRMSNAQHFRMRAKECRLLAKTAATLRDSSLLLVLADELDAEAQLIESEAAGKSRADKP
jgi:hypothetical protein